MTISQNCPNCFRKIKTVSNFCKYCGASLKLCPECKTLNKVEDIFCAECGYNIKSVEVAKGYKEVTEEFETDTEKELPSHEEENKEVVQDKEPKLIIWPPLSQSSYLSQVRPQPRAKPYIQFLDEEPTYSPAKVNYTYNRVHILGFLGGSLPTSSVFGSIIEAFGIALALIAAGIVIFSIGMAFFQYLVFPIIAGIIGAALFLSAPFFGIYYVSSKWLYRTFKIKRPVRLRTIIWNYVLASFIFSLLGLMLAPIFIQGGALGITLSIVGGIVYLMGLIVVPLKAFLADLIYVKAANNLKEEERILDILESLKQLLKSRPKIQKKSDIEILVEEMEKAKDRLRNIFLKEEFDVEEFFKAIGIKIDERLTK